MTYPLRFAALALAVACAARARQNPSRADARVARSRDSVPAVETSVSVSSLALAPGDRIDLSVAATNRGAQRVQIGIACGPSLDVLVRYPDGSEHSALWDAVGPNGDFTCPLLPSHFADPGQTKTERIPWRVPATPGTYRLLSGLRRADGLSNLSHAIDVTVR